MNEVFNEDVMTTLRRLPDNCMDMVYGDPDYNAGINYAGVRYTKTWEQYIRWYSNLARESMRVLKPTGNLFIINYPKQNAYLRVRYLDQAACRVFDYVWVYHTNVGHSPKRFTTAHRSVLHATKTPHNHFYKNQVALPYQNPRDGRIQKLMASGAPGRMPYSWWYYDMVKNVSREKTFHPCQIPCELFTMLAKAATKENDNIFVLFGGSGSELLACKKLNRKFISSEIHKA
jgi:site-specific DNA-methyltransferase (adenine-specific)